MAYGPYNASNRKEKLPMGNSMLGREKEAAEIEAIIAAGIPLGLVGPTGCGKTILLQAIAQKLGLPFYSVSGSAGATVDQLVGFWRPENGPNGVVLVWQDGSLTAAIRSGGIFRFGELSRAEPNILSRLFDCTDTHRPTYGAPEHGVEDASIAVHPTFRFVADYNEFGS